MYAHDTVQVCGLPNMRQCLSYNSYSFVAAPIGTLFPTVCGSSPKAFRLRWRRALLSSRFLSLLPCVSRNLLYCNRHHGCSGALQERVCPNLARPLSALASSRIGDAVMFREDMPLLPHFGSHGLPRSCMHNGHRCLVIHPPCCADFQSSREVQLD